MRILFCCEFYAPSVGGVQEVIRQIAERLVEKGHQVTVATSKLSSRKFEILNGVTIKEFTISGNLVRGVFGNVDQYRHYVINGGFDVMMIKAAQQWTFDALWPVLDQIQIPKVFIPCGFSGLMEPAYAGYFSAMPGILRKFDHLIFYASDYRDINFTKQHGITKFSIIPNGASEKEFNVLRDIEFRARNGVSADAFVFLTVGSFTGLKGHYEVACAFEKMVIPNDKIAILILNGNYNLRVSVGITSLPEKLLKLVKTYGIQYTSKHITKRLLGKIGIEVGKSSGFEDIALYINKIQKNKKVLITNFSRQELIQAYMTADLFVFASNIEYSPLVLFEAAAAGTPFLSVDVGNAKEISAWTQAGEICPSVKDEKGYTRVLPEILADKMAEMINRSYELEILGNRGRQNWAANFTWLKISEQYEKVFKNLFKSDL